MQLNLNDRITVTLTDKGAAIKQAEQSEHMTKIWKSGDQVTDRMHTIIETFGQHIKLGSKPPFRPEVEYHGLVEP